MPEFYDEDEKEAFYEVYDLGPDRSRAVVLVAMLENRLNDIFRALLRENKAIWNELFQTSGPLGNLGVKLRLLYMLGILPNGAYKDLIAFSKIRNEFAHKPKVRTFDDQPVCDFVRNLTTWKTFQDARDGLRAAADPELADTVMENIFSDSLTSNREMFRLAVRIYLGYLTALARQHSSLPETPR